jgi:hypothetical protein
MVINNIALNLMAVQRRVRGSKQVFFKTVIGSNIESKYLKYSIIPKVLYLFFTPLTRRWRGDLSHKGRGEVFSGIDIE